MMRLIDADSLHELIDGGFDLDFDEVPETKRELLRMVDEQETIDAMPVVLCKDCKWWIPHGKETPASIPAFGECQFKDRKFGTACWEFCFWGERKQE